MNRRKLIFQLLFLLLLVAGTVYIGCQQRAASGEPPFRREQGMVFGTFYSLAYQSDSSLQAQVEAALRQVDAEFSMFNPQSTVAAINRGEEPQRSAMFDEVYRLAMDVNADTHGAFDITVAPLVNAWGFGFKHEQMPTPEQVDSLLGVRSQMDFSAIAKGYGCDVAARTLRAHGCRNFMVEIGGEVVTSGHNEQVLPWHIGVNKPSDDSLKADGELQAVLAVADAAMATSGNYRNFYYHGGRKYAHTIDPRTGYPVQHELLSATVLAPTCAMADAYATSFMVLGLDSARLVLDRHPEMMAYLIYTDSLGQLATWLSPAMQELLQP